MDFDLSRLDARNFEQLTQSLAQNVVGARLTIFGDGPDGGREASWGSDGPTGEQKDAWPGYGVLQAKARLVAGANVADNLKWLKSQITSEARRWAESQQPRRTPDHYLLATNVALSASPGGGTDQAKAHVIRKFRDAGHRISSVTIWSYQELRALIENNEGVRNAYSAWITPGDILARIANQLDSRAAEFTSALNRHAVSSLLRDVQLKMNQTGTVKDQPIGVAQVFIDVPFTPTMNDRFWDPASDGPSASGVANHLIQLSDAMPVAGSADDEQNLLKRIALVGGPGQGKSTVTQFLAQLYRCSFLKDSASRLQDEVTQSLDLTTKRAEAIGLPLPSARRWPIRVVLPEFADALSSGASESVLDHIAREIRSRANSDATATDLVGWLRTFPWIMFLDGLDEVPASANRNQLMQALADFYELVRFEHADIVTVATTRPQGYDGEFGPIDHIELAPLDQATALQFADTFLDARNGESSDLNERTKALLRLAITQPATERLFESPLQATILAILIERMGHAPGDRWRLFSAYYQVISQREQEKLGKLAELLQTYSSEIDYLHRAVGRLLQDRGEDEGGARGVLSREELESIIRERLKANGHEDEEAMRLAADMMRLATERLVFLAMLTSDTAGFEIRSMQEFMAAEQITQDFSDEETFAQLRDIAQKPYWSNVFRFAAGRIFSQREILKPIIHQICQDMEASPSLTLVTRGRNLALDILSDGVVDIQPRYAIPLADHAARLLNGPFEERISDLARITSPAARARIDNAALIAAREGGLPAILSAIYAGVRGRDDDTFPSTPESIYSSQNKSTQIAMLQTAWAGSDQSLRAVAKKHIHEHDPALIFHSPFAEQRVNYRRSMDGVDDLWAASVRLFSPEPSSSKPKRIIFRGDNVNLSAHYTTLDEHRREWEVVRAEAPDSASWLFMRSVANLVIDGSASELAEALRAYAASPFSQRRGPSLPWVLTSTIKQALLLADRNQCDISSRVYEVAAEVVDGRWGERPDWMKAEETFSSEPVADLADLACSALRHTVFDELPFAALRFTWRSRPSEPSVSSPDILKSAGEYLLRLGSDNATRLSAPLVSHLGLFLVSISSRKDVTDSDQGRGDVGFGKDLLDALEASVTLLPARHFSVRWADWISSLSNEQIASTFQNGVFDQIGASPDAILRNDKRVAGVLATQIGAFGASVSKLILMARLDASMLSVSADILAQLVANGPFEADFVELLLLVSAGPGDVRAGLHRHRIVGLSAISDAPHKTLLLALLAQYARVTDDRENSDAICTEVYKQTRDTNIHLARHFARVLERRADSEGADQLL